ncbi:hypothetical protein BGZ70_003729, partial [Mortierella alpina]
MVATVASSELKHEDPDQYLDDNDQVPVADEWGPVVSHHKAPFEVGDVFFYTVLISLFFGGLHLYGERFWAHILATYSKPVILVLGVAVGGAGSVSVPKVVLAVQDPAAEGADVGL